MGYIHNTQATVTVGTTNIGAGLPRSLIRTPSMTVTAVGNNAGTVYIYADTDGAATVPHRSNVQRGASMIPLTAGQSFTFSGMERSGGNVRDSEFGAPYTWLLGSAAGQTAVVTYYKWDK